MNYQEIINYVCTHLEVSVKDILRKRGDDYKPTGTKFRDAKMIIIAILRNDHQLKEIGKIFNIDHSCVSHWLVKHNNQLDTDKLYQKKFIEISDKIGLIISDELKSKTLTFIKEEYESEIKTKISTWLENHKGMNLTPTLIDQFNLEIFNKKSFLK